MSDEGRNKTFCRWKKLVMRKRWAEEGLGEVAESFLRVEIFCVAFSLEENLSPNPGFT
jgi:hypothetical protein